MNEKSYSTYVEGPRWAAPRSALLDIANHTGVQIRFDGEEGWIRKRWYFTLTGTPDQMEHFIETIEYAVKAWNR